MGFFFDVVSILFKKKEIETVLCKCDCFVPRKDFTHVFARNEVISLARQLI